MNTENQIIILKVRNAKTLHVYYSNGGLQVYSYGAKNVENALRHSFNYEKNYSWKFTSLLLIDDETHESLILKRKYDTSYALCDFYVGLENDRFVSNCIIDNDDDYEEDYDDDYADNCDDELEDSEESTSQTYSDKAADIISKIQNEMSDSDRNYYWNKFGKELGISTNNFWVWLENLTSNEVEKLGRLISQEETKCIKEKQNDVDKVSEDVDDEEITERAMNVLKRIGTELTDQEKIKLLNDFYRNRKIPLVINNIDAFWSILEDFNSEEVEELEAYFPKKETDSKESSNFETVFSKTYSKLIESIKELQKSQEKPRENRDKTIQPAFQRLVQLEDENLKNLSKLAIKPSNNIIIIDTAVEMLAKIISYDIESLELTNLRKKFDETGHSVVIKEYYCLDKRFILEVQFSEGYICGLYLKSRFSNVIYGIDLVELKHNISTLK